MTIGTSSMLIVFEVHVIMPKINVIAINTTKHPNPRNKSGFNLFIHLFDSGLSFMIDNRFQFLYSILQRFSRHLYIFYNTRILCACLRHVYAAKFFKKFQ